MWKESSEQESCIRLLLKIANQIAFLMLLVRFIHWKLHGTTSWNSVWKSLAVVCCTLLASSCGWPIFLHVTYFFFSHHSNWILGILLLIIGWTSNRWLTTKIDPEIVHLQQSQQCITEKNEAIKHHSQGDVSEPIDSKRVCGVEYFGEENPYRTATIPKCTESSLPDGAAELCGSKENHEIDIEALDPSETTSKGTQTIISPSPQFLQSIETPVRHITFYMPQYKVLDRSDQQVDDIGYDLASMKIPTRSGRTYLRT